MDSQGGPRKGHPRFTDYRDLPVVPIMAAVGSLPRGRAPVELYIYRKQPESRKNFLRQM